MGLADTARLDRILKILEHRPGQACNELFHFDKYPSTDVGQVYCNSTWDTVLCWPTTIENGTVFLSCPEYFNEHKMAPGNVSKHCLPNGTWAKADYAECMPPDSKSDFLDTYHMNIQHIIMNVIYGLSTVALILALSIFLKYRGLRCLRNQIHTNLIVTFIMRNVTWIGLYWILYFEKDSMNQTLCKILVTVFHYTIITNFFWMLVEGFYLHLMVVWAFSVDKFRLWHFSILGWVIPLAILSAWIPVKMKYEDTKCWLPSHTGIKYDFVSVGPVLCVLAMNMVFLFSIVYVLITKLRASNSLQTRQYRKAVKATLFLLPLLGVTYVLFLIPPINNERVKLAYDYCNTILQSTQGLFVAIFYCFLNGEVQAVIKSHFSRWQDNRSFATLMTRASSITRCSIHVTNLEVSSKLLTKQCSGDDNGNGVHATSCSLVNENREDGNEGHRKG